MKSAHVKGKVQTVLGLIEPTSLGLTLMHEHLLTDLSVFFTPPKEATLREIAFQPVGLQNLHLIRYNPPSNADNCRYTDETMMISEATRFKRAGGNTIVEMSNTGLFGDPQGLSRIARATGLNIVVGAGFYICKSQSPETQAMSVDEMTAQIIREIRVEIGATGVRAGLIGEIGCNAPFEEFEKKSLRAAAAGQQETGAMINVHPSHTDELVLENVRVLKEAGADLTRVVISHVDIWGFSPSTIDRLLDQGCVVEFDTFGFEGIYPLYWGKHINAPTDEDRIKAIMRIIKKGQIDQVSVASDHCFKHLLACYGGGGYDHIIRNDIPLMRINGMADAEINQILFENPKRLLPFVKG